MSAKEQLREAKRELLQLREALDRVRYDKSFCCLKERTQEAVRHITDGPVVRPLCPLCGTDVPNNPHGLGVCVPVV